MLKQKFQKKEKAPKDSCYILPTEILKISSKTEGVTRYMRF